MKTSVSHSRQVKATAIPHTPPSPWYTRIPREAWIVAIILLLSLAFRFYFSVTFRLNPDEGFHFLFAHQPSLRDVRLETLTGIHTYPPLYVFLLHFTMMLGQSEFALRLPTLCFGTAFLLFAFLWTRQMFGSRAGIAALVLLAFSPGLVSLGYEVRNYALFLAATTVALYGLERVLRDKSAQWLAIAMLAEYVSILTNYSAVWICIVLGIFILVHIGKRHLNADLVRQWVLYQLGAVGICGWLYTTHIRSLRGSASEAALRRFLRDSYFWPETDNPISFSLRQTVAVFGYLLELQPLAVIGALLFAGALIWIASGRDQSIRHPMTTSLLLGLPVLLGCAAALAGVFPYGNSRHSSLFQPFLAAGLGYAISRLAPNRTAVLAILSCAVVPWSIAAHQRAPYIPGPADSRQSMLAAVAAIRSLPKDSTLLTDHPGLIRLGYYLGRNVYSPYHDRPHGTVDIQYDGYRLLCPCGPWTLDTQLLPGMLRDWLLAGKIPPEGLYIFQSDLSNLETELASLREPLRLQKVSRFGASALFHLRQP
ncbi:MAG: glycosyltransferase family 39 protein [Bryobacterales bacterium]|nr:glycosyltransferase family 39 protein [Bryobacterales bacterium]